MKKKMGRNEPCECGSLRKYKKCCYKSLDTLARERLDTARKENEKRRKSRPASSALALVALAVALAS